MHCTGSKANRRFDDSFDDLMYFFSQGTIRASN